MNNYNLPPEYHGAHQSQAYDAVSLDTRVSRVMRSVYVKMTLGLLVTALTALFCYTSPSVINFFAAHPATMWVLIIVELGLVFGISGAINRLSSPVATALFFLFAIVNGLMLFPIFMVYTHTSIAKTFFITAGTFGAMSIFGYTTSQDLTKWGNFLFMALIGLIIASLVNIFTHSSTLDWIISIAGVIIFVGLTAWDTQNVKKMAIMAPDGMTGRLATIGALSLYLDFINLFLYLLRFFGSSRD
ncbi:MAG: Bax inhibitor-1/YccA family protein [Pseudoflavonifractor sp.]|nr:Bax inhibitor-1/YccA family protein [Alloprevotella sp.]MCM1116301.1 Bax inhibitor-1/YccA family protein [Pseudoflavonifractor sp.]